MIRKSGLSLAFLASALMLIVAAPSISFAARGTKVKDNKIIVNGVKYRRKSAHDSTLGRYGKARGMQMDFKNEAPSKWLKKNVKKGTVVTLTSKMKKELNVKAAIKKAAKAKVSISSSRKAKLQLQFFSIKNESKIIDAINSNSKIKTRLKDYGKKARIVTGIWVLIDGNESSNKCGSGSLTVDTKKYGAYSVSGSGCSENAYSFSPDTIMAYEISKVKWKGTGKKKRVVDLKMDKMEL
jgi:hypothetical protein